ncbi:MAG: methyltransferase domain-containing protein [Xanthomonadales bacterium]|nr:methyltransferase domain-containing protein [Xanthomonadales bacterium]
MERSTTAREGALRRALVFALNFVKHPRMVGTFAVSSPALVRRLLDSTLWSEARRIVELGPGVGTITAAMLARMAPAARLLAIEMNRDFVAELGRQFPDPRLHVAHGSAADLHLHLREAGFDRVDLVVSGIPFSTMPPAIRDRTLDAVAATLAPAGCFLVYQYSAKVLPHLARRFAVVEREREWRNLVPVHVFRCRRPLAQS